MQNYASATTGGPRQRRTKRQVWWLATTLAEVRIPEHAEDPERIAFREALAFGKAVFDQRRALGLSVAELAARAAMTVDEVECIEEGGTEPTIALLRLSAAAMDSDVRLTAGHDLGSVWFEPHAA